MPTKSIPKYKLNRRKDRGTWEVSWFENGNRQRLTIGKIKETPKYVADKIVEQMRNEAIFGKEVVPVKSSSLEDFFSRYFEWARNVQQKAARTIEIEKNSVRHFLSVAPVDRLEEIDSEHVERSISLMKKKYSPTTINIMVRVWRMLMNRAIKWGLTKENPFKGLKPITVPEKLLRFCTNEQIESFILEAQKLDAKIGDGRGENAKEFKIELSVALGFFAGLRKQEIAFACWDWFDFEKKTVTVKNSVEFSTKSRKNRTLPMHSRLIEVLEKYREDKTTGYIFGKPWDYRKRFEYLCRVTGLEWVTPHIMRHTFGSLLAQQGVSLYKISKWMGHSHSRVTEIYAHLQEQDDEIEKL